MFKRVAVFVAAAVLAFAIAGCSSSGSDGSASSGQQQFEMLANDQGKNMVSDGEYLYFTDGEDIIYRSDLEMKSVVALDQSDHMRVFALCLADGKLYYSAEAEEKDSQGNGHFRYQIRCVDTDGKNSKTITHTSSIVHSVGVWQGMVVYVDKGTLKIAEPDSNIENMFTYKSMDIGSVQTTDEGIYFTAAETNDDAKKLCVFKGDMTKPDTTELAEIGNCNTFALCGSDIYYLAESETTGPGDTYYDLVKLDAQGNVTPTGVTGIFGNSSMYTNAPSRLCAYGNYIFYSKDEIDDKKHTWEWFPYCYNTVTGQEKMLDGYTKGNINVQVSDVSEGYVFLRSVSTGAGKDWVLSLTDPDSLVELSSIIENAEKLDASKAAESAGSTSAASSAAA